MDLKIKDDHRLNVLKNMTASEIKEKYKKRNELWGSLLAVYEQENKKEPNTRLQQEQIPDHCADQSRHRKYDLKLKMKEKSRRKKKPSVNENSDGEHNVAHEKNKERQKFKEFERQKTGLSAAVEENCFKDKDQKSPSVIVLHKYKKDLFNKKNELYAEEIYPTGKSNHRRDKNHKKTKVELKSHSQEHMLLNIKSSCENLKSSSKIGVEDKPSPIQREQFKDKIRKKHDKGVLVYKTFSTSLESKLRKKRKKLDKQQILKEVANRLNVNEDIYDKIKSLPIKIDENQLIFMDPSHIAKALECCEDKEINYQEKINTDSTCNEFNESISHNMNKKDKARTSSTKLALDNHASSKRLRILSSLKKIRRPIPVVLEEKSDISFIKVSKKKRDVKKRKSKLSSTKKRSVQEVSNTGKDPRGSHELRIENDLIQNENHPKQYSSVTKQNVCFGDNPIDTSNSKNDRMYTTVSDSLRIKPKLNNISSDLKNCSAAHERKNLFNKELSMRKNNIKESEKLRKIIHNSVGDSEEQIKSSVCEDEKKLTFQLIKTNMNSENCRRLRKNVYSVSDRRSLMDSKEKVSPILQNDSLYVTKRMLFYSNKEPSSTSKESLNIAIRRDTEISNNGSSNNILNVVIKQKKNSVTSTKSVISPKLGIENQCKHYNTKSLEKVVNENYLEKICKDEQKGFNKNKHLKEAECQTEENSLNTSNIKGGHNDNVPVQYSELGNNTMQAELCNFLVYHFQNMNPSFRKNNTISNSFDGEILNNKKLFQSALDKIDVDSKFGDHNSNSFTRNMKLSTEHQYCSIKLPENEQNFNTEFCMKSNCNSTMKPFYRIISNDECNLQKTKCDKIISVNKNSTSYKNENSNKIASTRPNLKIIEDKCPKTESEHIAEKLKSVGLSDKRSFVKVINSNYKLETPISTKVDFQDKSLPFKFIKSPEKQKDRHSEQVTSNKKDDFKKMFITRQQRQFSPTKIVETCKVANLSKQQITNFDLFRTKENGLLGNNYTNKTEPLKLNKKDFCNLEKTNNNNVNITLEDNLRPNKHNFVTVLSANEKTEKSSSNTMTRTKENHQSKFEVTKKTSYSVMKNFVVSEIGVQTESCDLLPTVPYKNISILKKDNNTKFDYIKELNNNETEFLQEKLKLSNKNNFDEFVLIDSVGILPQEKGSFVHVINKKCDTDVDLNNNNTLVEKKSYIGVSANFPENNREKKVSFLKSCDEEKHVIDKINAIYEFLQYLEKMLKDNSFLGLGTNIKNTYTIGNFNNTLRSLCSNGIEILNKIDVKESIDRNKILEVQKSLEKLVSLDKNKNSLFREIIDEPKYEYPKNVNNSSKVQYMTSSDLKNESVLSKDRTSNNHVNPFFVIISPDEKSLKQDDYECLKDVKSNKSLKTDNTKSGTNKSKNYFDFEDRQDEALLKQKVNKCVDVMKDEKYSSDKIMIADYLKNKVIHNKIPVDGHNPFDGKMTQRHTLSQDNSGKHLQISPCSEMFFEGESSINSVLKDNTTSNFKCNKTSRTVSNCLRNSRSKSKFDSYYCRNNTGHSCTNKHQNPNLNSNLSCISSKNTLNHVKNDGSKLKLISCCCCRCCIPKNISETNVCSYGTQNCSHVGCKNKLLSGIQSKAGSDFEMCKFYSNVMNNNSSQDIKPSDTRLWIRKMTSPFKIPFKKDDKSAKKKVTHRTDLPSSNIMTTYETIEKTSFEETIIESKNNFETKQCTVLPNISQNIINHSNCLKFTMVNEDNNKNKTYNRDSKTIVSQGNFKKEKLGSKSPVGSKHQECTYSFKRFDTNLHSPCGSVIVNNHLQNKSISEDINLSNSIEYLNTSNNNFDDKNEHNLESRNIDSDGWVRLSPSNITEIKNNELHLGVGINDLTVSHVEYIQKFPVNFSHCENFGEK